MGQRRTDRDVVLLSLGRRQRLKGVHIGLKAFAEASRLIVGDGPKRSTIEAQIAKLELGAKVVMAGNGGKENAGARYSAADTFLFPTMRVESGRR